MDCLGDGRVVYVPDVVLGEVEGVDEFDFGLGDEGLAGLFPGAEGVKQVLVVGCR